MNNLSVGAIAIAVTLGTGAYLSHVIHVIGGLFTPETTEQTATEQQQ